MQSPIGGARSHLTVDQVRSLIEGCSVEIDAGCEAIDVTSGETTDISEFLMPSGSSVSSSVSAVIHRTCRLRLTVELPWATTLLKPYMTMSGGGCAARFDLGVYEPGTPTEAVGETPRTFDVEAYDRLSRLRWAVGSSYSVPSQTGALAAVTDVISDAQESGLGVTFDGAVNDPLLTSDWIWPIASDSTWLKVANDMLSAVGYEPLWCDWQGRYRSAPLTTTAVRGTEWTYRANDPLLSIVEDGRRSARDLHPVPNRWVFVRRNMDQETAPIEGNGIVTFDNLDVGPASRSAFGGKVRTEVVELSAESHDALVALGQRQVESTLGLATHLEVQTGPNPLHWHNDVVRLVDSAEDSRWLVTDWELPLDGGSMRQSWRRIDALGVFGGQ